MGIQAIWLCGAFWASTFEYIREQRCHDCSRGNHCSYHCQSFWRWETMECRVFPTLVSQLYSFTSLLWCRQKENIFPLSTLLLWAFWEWLALLWRLPPRKLSPVNFLMTFQIRYALLVWSSFQLHYSCHAFSDYWSWIRRCLYNNSRNA